MRGGILAVGLVLLVIGIFLYFAGNNAVRSIERYNIEDIPISELLMTLAPSLRNQYETGQSMIMFGSIFGIVGFILCVAGIAAPGKKPEVVKQPIVIKEPQKESSPSDRRCPDCGRVIPSDAKLCPYCGKKFKSHYGEDEEEKKLDLESKEEKEQESSTKGTKYCPQCGAPLEDSPKFCYKCGNKLR